MKSLNMPAFIGTDIDQEKLKRFLIYMPESGNFYWKYRDNSFFKKCPKFGYRAGVCWNAKYSGKKAGFINKYGYRAITIDHQGVTAHRAAWLYVNGSVPPVLDHINQNRDDNRICNLRPSSYADNNKNASRRKDNRSGVTGVGWHKSNNTWIARINNSGNNIHLGSFDTKQKAIAARVNAELLYNYSENHGS